MKIAIASTEYVKLSNRILLFQQDGVIAYDIIPQKVKIITKNISPIEVKRSEEYLRRNNFNFTVKSL